MKIVKPPSSLARERPKFQRDVASSSKALSVTGYAVFRIEPHPLDNDLLTRSIIHFVRPHRAFRGSTPADEAQVGIDCKNRWIELFL